MLYNIFKCFNNSIYIFVFVVLGLKWSFNKSCWIFFMELFCIILIFLLWIRKIVRKCEIKLVIIYIFCSGIVWMYFNVYKLYNVYGNY